MKSFAKISTLFLFTLLFFVFVPAKANPVIGNNKSFMVYLLGSNHVKIGTLVSTELYSHYSGDARLTVENAKGQCFAQAAVSMKYGKNIVKFKVSDIPAGVYFIKVAADSKTETTTFVVE